MTEPLAGWKWANFAILAAGIVYMAAKSLPAVFRSRTEAIQKGIAEAQKIKRDAEKRAAEVDARLRSLGADIETFRSQAREEMEKESQRIRQETAALMAKLELQAQSEIESAGKAARRELRVYAADLAMDLAGQRIRARLDASTEAALIDNFSADLGKGAVN
jgi:F-type H+-transporting ATPase subunit b